MSEINLGQVVGPRGFQGIQGVKGDKGDQGIQGEVGPKVDVAASLGTSTVYAVSQKLLTDEVDKMTSTIATIKSQSDASIVKVDNADTKIDTKTSELLTSILGINKKLTNRINALEESTISSLFNNGVSNGIWLDPSDLKTMYQDSKGITPVTKDGDPVGLILDKSKGLVKGEDLLASWDFLDWQVGGTYVSRTKNTVTFNYSGAPNTSVINKELIGSGYYILEMDFTFTGLGSEYFDIYFRGVGGSKRLRGDATSLTMIVRDISSIEFRSNALSNASITVNKMSLKKLDGNHATQPLAASRPTYRTDGNLHWLEFDGVDDYLVSTLASIKQPYSVAIAKDEPMVYGPSMTYIDSANSTTRVVRYAGEYYTWKVDGKISPTVWIDSPAKCVMSLNIDGLNSSIRFNDTSYLKQSGTGAIAGETTIFKYNGGTSTKKAMMYGFIIAQNTVNNNIEMLRTYLANKAGVEI